ncbi:MULTISPECIES: 2Fe-2S iron-sulfur cluster-binding protein [Halobacteriovorax]|uniref:(2Fe-2S)-binding protein n=1 Tax=Halobacteriovorax vibrionivorans TaxID=2152716 RepID=A0ABY0IEN3_9BACT|nr:MULTISPECIES: 2Fe-2S iron-sulfur cluster-binding protein [Halobacteriovorax]AYF44494.1 2Fe-2S iron-sulfur cluster-binding domain protein [Halobacteriovorax sp. BALOs_7]RZF20553.1 (2Fe-2S)-binding protein [Halobacteriovorax vibrionivorans]TGD47466.1 (2Fe-2S)-binding protein [Halobacteriovorax sp. Y22]
MFKVTLAPSNETIYVDDEMSLLEHLKKNGIYVNSSCGGHGTCTDCIVKVLSGADNLNEPTDVETKLLGNVFHITKERMSCQTIVNGETTIDMSDHSKEGVEAKREAKNKKVVNEKLSALKRSGNFKVRKKDEVEKVMSERQAKWEDKQSRQEDWKNHWEKGDRSKAKRLGGGRRPKNIKPIKEDEE